MFGLELGCAEFLKKSSPPHFLSFCCLDLSFILVGLLMKVDVILILGSAYHLCLVAFHLLFWKLKFFNWQEELPEMSFLNRNVIQIINLCLTYVFVIFAYISFFHRAELLNSALGVFLLISISVFWLLRALMQIRFFGIKNKTSMGFFLFFMLGFVLYLSPVLLIQ